mmetsp:Transcript_29559/g.28296  ORF Transcript_29559/g.28296 Transcript_29559/m.28296 type:complete len:133 (-) Transcript_29559:331-729(-)
MNKCVPLGSKIWPLAALDEVEVVVVEEVAEEVNNSEQEMPVEMVADLVDQVVVQEVELGEEDLAKDHQHLEVVVGLLSLLIAKVHLETKTVGEPAIQMTIVLGKASTKHIELVHGSFFSYSSIPLLLYVAYR